MGATRILLVEDNYDNLQLVRFLLERSGYEVIEAHNGKQGLDIALQEHPDLILMDLSMPDVDGWEAARMLKANSATRSIPLLALTAHTLPGDRKRAIEAGCDGYLSKPINVAQLEKTIKDALDGNS